MDTTPRATARKEGRTRYFGLLCKKHPDAKGERHTVSSACVACRRAQKRASRRVGGAHRERHLREAYGITTAQFDAILATQDMRCALCGTSEPVSGEWTVDHDHATNRVRGVLCHRCNLALGHLQDDPARARAAADYLERHKLLNG